MSKFNADATNGMRKNLFAKLQRMKIRYFDTSSRREDIIVIYFRYR